MVDIDPVTAANRQSSRAELDRMENQKLDFYRKVREGFLSIAAAEPERFFIVEGDREIGEINEQIVAHINSRFHL